MPVRTFPLPSEGNLPETITINWNFNWKNLEVRKDGEEIGHCPNREELQKGQSFTLQNGRVLFLQLKRQGLNQALEVLLNGQPLPGSGTDPKEQVKAAVYVLYFIAGFNLLIGLLTELVPLDFLLSLGAGMGTVVIGIINFGLAYLLHYKSSAIALYAAIGLLVLDLVLSLVYAADTGGNPMAGLFLKLFFLSILYTAMKVLQQVRAQELAVKSLNS